MIENTPIFQYQLYECFRGQPGNKDIRITIPYLKKEERKITAAYKKAYLPNPLFPVELYEYRRDSIIQLSTEGKMKSEFAEKNLVRNIYQNNYMRPNVTALIDGCRQNMKSELETELDDS